MNKLVLKRPVTNQDGLGLWMPQTGFRIPCRWNLDSDYQSSVEFLIPWAEIRIPKPRILDSTGKNQQNPESGLPYIGRGLVSKQLGNKMTGKLPKQPYLLRLVSFCDMESLWVSLKKEHSQPSMTSDSSCLTTRLWWSLSSVFWKPDSSLIQLSNPRWRDGITGGVRICRKYSTMRVKA